MTEKTQETAQNLSKLVEQSVSTLQEVDRRLQMVRSDLATLIGRASSLQQQAQGPGFPPVPGLLGAEAFGMRPPIFGAGAFPQGAPGLGLGPVLGAPALPGGLPAFGGVPPTGAPSLGFPPGGTGARSAKELALLPPQQRMPNVDLVDQGEEYLVQIEMAGVKKEDLDIMVSDRTITVSGQVRPDVGDGALLLSERGPILYRRMIPLPAEVQTTQSKATFKDGILTLTVRKKTPGEGPRRLDVAYG